MVIENAYYRADVHGPFALADLDDLVLEDGPTLRGCQLAHQTLGTLNDAKDSAVLVTSWHSGNHSVMRETYVGAGRAIDPAEHDVVLVNQVGSGPGWASGRYAASADVAGGLRRHEGLLASHVLSNDFWTFGHWRALGLSTAEDFRVGFLEGYFEPMDAAVLGSELRVIEDVHGHAALFGLGADYAEQVDAALSDLLATSV